MGKPWKLQATAPISKLAESLRGARNATYADDPEAQSADAQISAGIAAVEALAADPATGGDVWYAVSLSGKAEGDENDKLDISIKQAPEPEDAVVVTTPEAATPPDYEPGSEFGPAEGTGQGTPQPEDTEAFTTGEHANEAQKALKEGQAETEAQLEETPLEDMTRAELDEVAAKEIEDYSPSAYATKADVIDAIEEVRQPA